MFWLYLFLCFFSATQMVGNYLIAYYWDGVAWGGVGLVWGYVAIRRGMRA